MKREIDRRDVLKGAGAAVLGVALPARVFAQASPVSEAHRRVLGVARDRMEQYRASLWRTDLVGIADFGLPSNLPRFHFANLENGTVRSFLVAHGRGSDPEHEGVLKWFSNEPNSLATSRGAYITYEWYSGKYGTSIRLGGMDADNSNVLNHAIVLHPAWYANAAVIEKWGKLGRSDGCFAMGEADFNEALWHLSGGRLIFADRLGIG